MIPFVHRNPEKHEIERLRQILSRYNPGEIASMRSSIMNMLNNIDIKIISEAFGLHLDKYFLNEIKINGNNSECKIVINPRTSSFWGSERGSVNKVEWSFTSFWDRLSKYNIDIESYRESPDKVGIAAVNMLFEHDSNLDLTKCSYLYLSIGEENRAQLHQYYYFVDPQKLHWYFDEKIDKYGFESLYGYDHDKVYQIRMNRNEILEYGNALKSQVKKKKNIKYRSISIGYFLSQHRMIWHSDIIQIEPLSKTQIFEFHTMSAAKKQKEVALAELEEYIENDPKEEKFQELLSKNPWMFGSEYSELLDERVLVIGSQQDFVFRRTKDDLIEVVEIKRSLNGKKLFNYDKDHNSLYPRTELSKAIGQVIQYIDDIDSDYYSILVKRNIDTNKTEVKLIIGRDGDDKQVKALNNFNHHLNRIKILTFDQLLRIAQKTFMDQFGKD